MSSGFLWDGKCSPCPVCSVPNSITLTVRCSLLTRCRQQYPLPSVTSQQQMKVDFGQSLTVNGRKVTRDEQRKYNCGRIYCREIVKASDKAWYRGLVPIIWLWTISVWYKMFPDKWIFVQVMETGKRWNDMREDSRLFSKSLIFQ